MISKIKSIKFKGAAFDNETTLQLFSQEETDRACIIFGRNGSGKSTVSRAISKTIDTNNAEDIVSAHLLDFSNINLSLTDNEKKHIFVFNEDYVSKNIRFQEEGLNTIVMFGEIANIAEKIEIATEILQKAEKDYSVQNDIFISYCNSSSVKSPENQYDKMKNALKGDDSWADRERLILGTRQNASVNDSIINEITQITLLPIETKELLLNTYNTKYAELQTAKTANSKITAVVPSVIDYTDTIYNIKSLLAVEIDQPILTEREKTLLIMAQSGKQLRLTEMKTEFSSDTDTCSFCLQTVTDKYKVDLIASIEKVLNESAEKHRDELENNKIPLVNLDFTAFEVADKLTAENCNNAVNALNTMITECNQTIQKKIDNLYTAIKDFSCDLIAAAELLKIKLSELDKKKTEYNELSSKVEIIREDLKELNMKLASLEIKESYADYLKQKEEKQIEENKLHELKLVLENAKSELENLNQKKKNVKIAEEFINKGLQYVFFSSNRLSIIPNGDNYAILSNGKSVKPKNISVGERNILSLCYFFTEILNYVDEKDIYKNEYLIVLDDPVSSFDLENRIGIISFLKSQIIKILRGNSNSKIVLLSHDLLTVYDIDKAFDEIKKQIKFQIANEQKTMVYRLLELDKHILSDLGRKNRNEYSQLLKSIYEYAKNMSDDYELIIGNIMRRALEAFSTFEYRKSIEEISYDQTILRIIHEDKKDYFENLMYRLILHGESHLEERAKSLTDNNFFATITTDEKKRTARDVLCLMYQLNANHIEAHFSAMKDELGNDVISNIKKWLNVINSSNKEEE